MIKREVVILQEYVPKYREALYSAIDEAAESADISVTVACGKPSQAQAARDDVSTSTNYALIRQREYKLMGRRIVLRQVGDAIKSADLVVLEQARRNIDSYRLFLPRTARHPKFALWGHGKDYVLKASRAEQRIRNELTLRADWFFAYTHRGAQAVADLGFPQHRITTLNNTIDTRTLRSSYAEFSDDEVAGFQSKHGLSNKTAIFIGGLDESKRIPFLLSAADKAFELDRDFRLIVVGDGLHNNLARAAALEKSYVTWLGPLTGRNKALALRACNVIAMPGRVGLIAVDSLAIGVPLVTTDWPWHAPEADYLEDGVTSIFSDDSVEAYASALVNLLSSPVELERLRLGCLSEGSSLSVEKTADTFVSGMVSALG